MRRDYFAIVLAAGTVMGLIGTRVLALDTVVWDGTTSNQWHEANWTKNGVPGLTANAAIGQDGNTGGRGGVNMIIGGGAQVIHNHNRGCPSSGACDPLGQGDFKPRMDLVAGGSLTIKEGASLSMDSHTDTDGRWSRVSIDVTLDNGLWRRTHSAPSEAGGKIIFGYGNELKANQKININLLNGGRIENDGKIIFGDLDYFTSQGGSNNGHQDGIEVAMNINNGSLDLTGGGYPDYPFGLISGELVFAYEYHENVGPRNEKYSINFTGPGSITVDPHFDATLFQYLGGIYVAKQDSTGTWNPLGGGPDFFTPIGYEDLWNLGILQANGQSGLTGATFGTYFTTTGDKFHENYTLTSLLAAPGLPADYNNDGKVDAADYVLWRNGGPLQNEVDAPGTVNAADYTAWRARFGNSAGSGAGLSTGAVPEASSAVLLLLGVAGWWSRRGRSN
ncbi:MAG: hypothetical protein U0805_22990 [Pirellulales bacterium]